MYFYKLMVSLFCLTMMSVGLAEGRRMRRRRGDCTYGTYQHEGKACCLCPSGYRVISDCKDNNVTQCEICQSGFFATHPNNDHTCRHCTDCHPEATKMEKKDSCSSYSDTVCGCQENYYCDKGHLCRTCQPCDTCEKQGVKIPCTFTNNTVCHGAKESGTRKGGIVAAVLVPLILIIVCLVFFLIYKKQMFCFEDRQMKDDPKLQELLPKDVDLNPYLPEIASILPPKLMKEVARRTGMPEPDIDQHELNHPRDVKEQTYRLLLDWSQSQGLNEAYPTLITKLLELKAKRTADHVRQIVQREQATA